MIKHTEDLNHIQELILSDYIFDKIAPDNVNKEDVKASNIHSRIWFVFTDNNGVEAGIIGITNLNNICIEIHPYILDGFSEKGLGKQMMSEFFKFVLEYGPEIIKINCKIPKCFADVYRFAKKVGFLDEGIDRQSFLKFGSVWDQNYLGITRKEIEDRYLWAL